MAKQVDRRNLLKRSSDNGGALSERRVSNGSELGGRDPDALIDAIGMQVLATEAAADPDVRALTRFLERQGVLLQSGLVVAGKTGAGGDELLAIALGLFGRGIAYVVHVRGAGVREAAAFVVGGHAFMLRNGEVGVIPLRPEYRRVLATWPFSMSVASSDPAVRRHCDAVCGPCFLWLATSAALTYRCVTGTFDSCPGALAARGQAERHCFQCVGCDWSP